MAYGATRIGINSPQLESANGPPQEQEVDPPAWNAILLLIRSKERLWTTILFSLIASFTAMPGGYTLAYSSSALLDLRNISDDRVFIPDSAIENLFGVSLSIYFALS
jgi:hypothetical protein